MRVLRERERELEKRERESKQICFERPWSLRHIHVSTSESPEVCDDCI